MIVHAKDELQMSVRTSLCNISSVKSLFGLRVLDNSLKELFF